MKLYLVNTLTGLVPYTDDDYEAKCKLKIGSVYETTVKEVRNVKFHRLFFALLNCAWEYLSEPLQLKLGNKEHFRETLLVATGHTTTFYDIERQEWLERAKSIAFDKMDESEFSDFYERAKDVIYNYFIPNVNKKEFEQHLKNF